MEERPGVPPAPAPSWPGSSASDSNPPSRRESGSVVTSIRRVRNSYSAAAGEKDNSLRVSHRCAWKQPRNATAVFFFFLFTPPREHRSMRIHARQRRH